MKKKKKILFLTILLGFILGLSITTISILNSKNKIDTKNIENIARKYLNDNDIHCDSYCEVTSKELNQSGYLKDNNNDLKISFTNYNGDLEANIYQLSSLENTTVSGYQAEISESKEPNTNASITYTDNSVEITGENSYAGFNYLISGLKKEQLYIATANITLENLQGSGAYISASDSYSDTLSTSKTDTLKMVFKTSNTDKMNILVFLGFNNRKAQGKLTINNLTLKEADNDVKIFTSSNNLIKSIYWTSDLTKNNIQTAKLNEYVEKLENVYNAYADLVGHTSRSEELLYPINKNTIYIFNTNDTEYYMAAAYASQRIQMDRNYIEQFEANAIKNDDIYWNVLHEMGHVFTINQLSNDDVKSNLNITFEVILSVEIIILQQQILPIIIMN